MGRGHSLVDDLLKVCVEGMYVCWVCVRGGGVGVVLFMTCSRFVCKCMFAGCVCVGWGVTLRFVQSVCGGNVGLQGVCAWVGALVYDLFCTMNNVT